MTESDHTTAPVKRYGDDGDVEELERYPFVAVFRRNGIPEDHEFTAAPNIDYKAALGLGSGETMRTLQAMDRLLRQSLVDDDGVPTTHVPDDMIGDAPFEQWSSRRRWCYLMDQDDGVTIADRVITAMFQDLFKVATRGRPTKRSAHSSR